MARRQHAGPHAVYSKYPLAKEAGIPTPRVWEGYKGQASKPAGDFTMEAKRFMAEKIAELSVGYIKKQGIKHGGGLDARASDESHHHLQGVHRPVP